MASRADPIAATNCRCGECCKEQWDAQPKEYSKWNATSVGNVACAALHGPQPWNEKYGADLGAYAKWKGVTLKFTVGENVTFGTDSAGGDPSGLLSAGDVKESDGFETAILNEK